MLIEYNLKIRIKDKSRHNTFVIFETSAKRLNSCRFPLQCVFIQRCKGHGYILSTREVRSLVSLWIYLFGWLLLLLFWSRLSRWSGFPSSSNKNSLMQIRIWIATYNSFHFTSDHFLTANIPISNPLLTRIFLPPRICDPILVTLLKCNPFVVNPVVKMRTHPAAHPH